jgi:aspartate/methionine/tyrosine aminotransferase
MAPDEKLNPIARALDERLAEAAPEVRAMLSPLGRRLYFPKGILTQSAEAKERGHRFNATIGIATEGGHAMYLPAVHRQLHGLEPDDVYPYAPGGGRPGLRARWREKQLAENPSQRGKVVGLPIVTSALTHGLSVVGDLFVAPGDRILLPDKLWGNYRLAYEVRYGAEIATWPFYAGEGFDVAGFRRLLEAEAATHEKLLVLLNFPNNPTGYMPTEEEGDALVEALVRRAEAGTRIVAICDDAYFGLFYHLGRPSMTESLFGRLANRHPNLLAVKLDGATKELFVWGLRCGFLTFGPGRPETAETVCEVLDAKSRGAIRAGISNSPQLSQTLVEHALAAPSIEDERKEKCEILRARAERVHEVANAPRYAESFRVYPFNSGYFMCIAVEGVDAERLRVHLLDAYGTGLVATSETDLRIAFSCLELDDVAPLFEVIHKAVQELRED